MSNLLHLRSGTTSILTFAIWGGGLGEGEGCLSSGHFPREKWNFCSEFKK